MHGGGHRGRVLAGAEVRFCLAPGCGEVVDGRRVAYCPQHEPERTPWRGSTHRATRGPEWYALRKKVLQRDGHSCQEPGCTAPGTVVDHVVPAAEGGRTVLGNLQALCQRHSDEKTERERRRGVRRRSGRTNGRS